jgi:hypothetical protein
MLVPTNVAVRARDIIATNIGDVYAATYIVRDLLSKVTTLGFGWMHGHFVISIGTESGVPVLSDSPDRSLVGAPPVQRLEPLLGEGADILFYADPLVVSLAAAPPPVAEYLDAALEAALEFAPAPTIDPLRKAAGPLREQAAELFRPRFSAVSGVIRQKHESWQAELFGGSLAPRLALGNAAPLFGRTDGAIATRCGQTHRGRARSAVRLGRVLRRNHAAPAHAAGCCGTGHSSARGRRRRAA